MCRLIMVTVLVDCDLNPMMIELAVTVNQGNYDS